MSPWTTGEWKLSEVNTRTVSRGQNELIDEFKMAAGDVISIGGRFLLMCTGEWCAFLLVCVCCV